MGEITTGQLKLIKTVMGKQKIKDADVIVSGFTGFRTKHVSEMTFVEADALIKHLKDAEPLPDGDKMRKKLIAMAYKYKGLSPYATKEQKREAIAWLDSWCRTSGAKKKGLNAYPVRDLPILVTQMEKVLVGMLKKV